MEDWDGGNCILCKKKIENPEDAVVGFGLFSNPYQHYECFSDRIKWAGGMDSAGAKGAAFLAGGFAAAHGVSATAERIRAATKIATRSSIQQHISYTNKSSLVAIIPLDVLVVLGLANLAKIQGSPVFYLAFAALCLIALLLSVQYLLYYVRLKELEQLINQRQEKMQGNEG